MELKLRDKASCHLSWSNIVKTVIPKENAGGLIKSTIGESADTGNSILQNSTADSNKKLILNQISGQAKPGEIMALMGPSGSGKTSLLDVLSGRSAYQDGSISMNGTTITGNSGKAKALKRRTAYIKQQDIFFDHLTVKDQLMYMAFLRLGDDYTKEEKREEVSKVISMLRLNKCQDTPIRLVSGGEKKRVNIGTELLTNPDIIMLDEPTSGLDSTSAVALIDLLIDLAHNHGKTVVTSIHQPSSAVFHKFDNVLFLADGCVVYYGSPAKSLDYVDELGFPCPGGYNAADHWMDLLVEDSAIESESLTDENEKASLIQNQAGNFPIQLESDTPETTGLKDEETAQKHSSLDRKKSGSEGKKARGFLRKISTAASKEPHLLELTKMKRDEYKTKTTPKAALINRWDVDTFAEMMEDCRDSLSVSHHSSVDGGDLIEDEKKFNTSWSTQFYVLMHRSLKNSHAAILTPLNLFKSIALAILTGLLWFQMPNDANHVSDKGSFLFFTITYWIFDGTFNAIFAFPLERSIIFKERASGSYQLSAYFLAKTFSEIPTRLCLPVIFWTIAYWMAYQDAGLDVFFGSMACLLLASLAGESYGLLCGALVMDFEKAMVVMVVISLTQMAAGGFYVQNIPSFISWIKYLSPFKSGYEAALLVVFNGDVPCNSDSDAFAEYCTEGVTHVSRDEVLKYLYSEGTVASNVGILIAIALVPRYLAYLALKNKKGAERS